MKIAFIATVLNEEKTIIKLLNSLFNQTRLPDEIIIVDGGSNDLTVENIKNQKLKNKNYKGKFSILIKKGNRSIGRNEAIRHASGDIIACSDAGNILDKNWLKNIAEPFKDKKIDAVAGYYKGEATSLFQKSLIPYVLVMPDRVDPENFLPATRSIAFTKSIWTKSGGFNEQLSHNEDYTYARELKKIKAKLVFAENAIVYWLPRKTFKEAFRMFFRFAYGDAEAGILRSKVIFIFIRYFMGLSLLILTIYFKSFFLLSILFIILVSYILWSIQKNIKYVKDWRGVFVLPALQFVSDAAVLSGTALGLLK